MMFEVCPAKVAAVAILTAGGQDIEKVFGDIAIGNIPAIGHPMGGVQKVEEIASVMALGICLH